MRKCLICPKPVVKGVSTGSFFREDGKKRLNDLIFCSEACANRFVMGYANPVFQNQKALELFIKKHPQLYARIEKLPKLFMEAEVNE